MSFRKFLKKATGMKTGKRILSKSGMMGGVGSKGGRSAFKGMIDRMFSSVKKRRG